jgi:hypothetical protein
MRKYFLTVVAVAATGLVIVAASAAGSYRGIEPVLVAGNPGCKDLAGLSYSAEVKFVSPVNGMSAGGIHLFVEESGVGWYVLLNENVRAVIVKGGTNANVYRYPGGDFSDGSLVPPRNPKNGSLYGLGSVTFCYDPPA